MRTPATDQITTITARQVAPRWIFVQVRTAEGLVGWGEAIVPKRPQAVLGAIADIAANITGSDPSRIEELWQRMRRGAFYRGGPILGAAAAGIEQALWDIKGRRHDLPVHEFLGGAVRDRVRVYAWIGGDRPADVVEATRRRMQQGFTAVKMNATSEADFIGASAVVDATVSRVGAIRDAFGYDVDVALDFHGRVHRSVAKALLRELEQYRLLWVEEPITPGHEDALIEIARCAGSTPIATGERLYSRWEFKRLLEQHVVDVLQPDISITGLFEVEKIARMAEAYDVAVAPHCPNGPISLAASLQVGLCALNIPIQEQSFQQHYNLGYAGLPTAEMFDYLTDPTVLQPVDGHVPRLLGPGLGIEIDPAEVDRRAEAWRLPDPDWHHADGRIAEW